MQSTGFPTSDSFLSDSPLNVSSLLSGEGIGELPSFDSDFGSYPVPRRASPLPQTLEQIRSPQLLESRRIDELPKYDSNFGIHSTPKKISPRANYLDQFNLSQYLEEEGIDELPSFHSSFGRQSTSSKIFDEVEGIQDLNLSQYFEEEGIGELPSFDSSFGKLQPSGRISPIAQSSDQFAYPQYPSDEGIGKPPSIDSSFGKRSTPTRISPQEEISNQFVQPQRRGDELIDLISFLSGSEPRQDLSLGLLSGFGPFPKRYADVQTSTISPTFVINSFSDLESCCDSYDYLPSSSLKEFCLQNRGKVEGYDSMKEQLMSFLTTYQPQIVSSNAPESQILSEAVRSILEDLMKAKAAACNLQKEKSLQRQEIETLSNKIQNLQLMPRTSPTQDKGLQSMKTPPKLPGYLSRGAQAPQRKMQVTPKRQAQPRMGPTKMLAQQKMQALPRMQAQPKMQSPQNVQPPAVSRQLPGPSKIMVKPQKTPIPTRTVPRGPFLGYPGGQGSTQKTVMLSSPSGKTPIVVDVNVTARPIDQIVAGPQKGLKAPGLPRGKSGFAPPGGKFTRGPTATRMPQGLPKDYNFLLRSKRKEKFNQPLNYLIFTIL